MNSYTKFSSLWFVLFTGFIGLVMIYSLSMFVLMIIPVGDIPSSQSDSNVTIGYGVLLGITATAFFINLRRLR
jgi:RsiW-degrading membrane proteinase PrsW (M82 family)